MTVTTVMHAMPSGGHRTVRVDVKRGTISLMPLANGGTRVVAVFHVDPKLEKLPAWCAWPISAYHTAQPSLHL